MKKLLLNNSFVELWKDTIKSKSPLQYLVAFWITGLALLAIGGWITLVIHWSMNPNMWDGVQFGIYDTLGS